VAKTNPFASGKDDDSDTDKRVKDMQRTAKEADERDGPDEGEEEDTEADKFEVGGGRDDDADDGDDDSGRPSRKDRRRQRGDDMVRAANERAEKAERDAQEHRRLMAEAFARIPTAPQQPRVDPVRQRLDQEAEALQDQQQTMVDRYQAAQEAAFKAKTQLSPEVHAKFQADARKLRDRIAENDHHRFAPRQQGGVNEQQIAAVSARARAMQDHGDVFGNQRAAAAFQAEYIRLIKVRGEPDNWTTFEKAADAARREVGLAPRGGRPAPSRGAKSKYTGVSRGGSGGDDGRVTVTMDKDMKAMADTMYSHIKDPKKRYQRYADRVGSKTVAKRT
jgi:hypothetical protein